MTRPLTAEVDQLSAHVRDIAETLGVDLSDKNAQLAVLAVCLTLSAKEAQASGPTTFLMDAWAEAVR